MSNTIFIKESNLNSREVVYVKGPENSVQRLNASLNPRNNFLKQIIKDVLLPQGYPDTVSKDYKPYQLWDTVQAFCSTITNTLSTRAILQGVGVGDEAASSVSAAITWIFKDGVGMVSRILFAWISGGRLDGDCKKWRLFADIMNDVAICTEIFLLPLFKDHALEILCISTSVKGIVGVAGGATRASITQHQAIKNNTADVSAKDGSQETCVNLIASVVGILFLKFCGDSSLTVWNVFFILTVMHLYANYRAVRALKINKFNTERLNYVIKEYLLNGNIALPEDANRNESVLLGTGISSKKLCGCSIKLGYSIEKLTKLEQLYPFELQLLTHLYRKRKYLIIVSMKSQEIYVLLQKNVSTPELLEAYFHAVIQGITASYVLNRKLTILQKNNIRGPFTLLHRIMKSIETNLNGVQNRKRIDADVTIHVDNIATNEVNEFVNALPKIGWNIDDSYLYVGDWRASWKDTLTAASDENIY